MPAAQPAALPSAPELLHALDQLPLHLLLLRGPDLVLAYASARSRDFIGAESLGQPVRLARPAPDAALLAALHEVYRTGQPWRGQPTEVQPLHTPPGAAPRLLEFSLQATRTLTGAIDGVLLTGLDLTEQYAAQAQAQVAREAAAEVTAQVGAARLLRLAESQPSTGFAVDASGTIIFISPQWYAYTGLTPETDINAAWPALIHPDDLPAVAEAFGAALAQGTAWSYNFRLRGAHGHYRWFASQGQPEPLAEAEAAGRPRQWFGSSLDIDDLKQAQAALQAQETRLTSILNQLPLTISTVEGPELRFTFLSAMARTGMGPRAEVGRRVADCLPEIAAQGYTNLLARVRDTGQPVLGYEERSELQDPTTGELGEVFNNYGFVPLRGADNAIGGVLAYGLNVTGQVRSRQRAEAAHAAAHATNQRLRLLTESLPLITYESYPDGSMAYLSPQWLAYTGQDAATFKPVRDWMQAIHPDDVAGLYAAFAPGLEPGFGQAAAGAMGPFETELRLRRHDGQYRWHLTRAAPQFDPATGQVQRWYGSTVDIQALRQAQAELAEREAQLRTLTETIPQLVWTVEADGTTSYVNQRYTNFTGLDVPELARQGWNVLIHPDDLDRTLADFGQQLAAGAELNMESRLRHYAGGPYRWFLHRTVAQHDAQGRFLRWYGTSTDVQQQHELQERLQNSEAELRIQAESLPQQIWTAGPDGVLDFYNHRTTAYLGVNPAQSPGTSWLDYLHPDDRPEATERWGAALAEGRYYEAEFRLRRYDGQYRWFLAQAQARRTPNGPVLRWYGTNTDIEDQKRSQRLLVEQNTRLKRTNRDLDNFVYTASHDLKQPVTNMAGIFEELRRTAAFADPEAPKLLAMFDRALAQIYTTIDDLGAIVRVQRPISVQEMEPVDLLALTDEVLASLQDMSARLRAEIVVNFAACSRLQAVRSHLQSVFFNLISNALKYADPARPPRIRVSSAPHPGTGNPVLVFTDNGRGLDLAKVGPQLFQQFSRFHPDVEGSGMGLYLVNRIVEQAGGHIDVTSTVDVGTTFTIYWGD